MTDYSKIAEQQRDEIAAAQVARNAARIEARAKAMHQAAGVSDAWEGRKTSRSYWRRQARKEVSQ